MTSPDAVDYSWARPNPKDLAAAGIKLVARYGSHDPSKNLSAQEAKDLHAAGIGIVLNWEADAGAPLLGGGQGHEDGQDAATWAESLGAPHGTTIYYSCDRDVDSTQFATIADYYRSAGAATAGRYTVGVYGEADLIEYLHNAGVTLGEWQTLAWSNGRLSSQADLYQFAINNTIAGASVDFNKIEHPASLGAWWPAGSPYLTSGEDDEMTPADWAKLQKMINDAAAATAAAVHTDNVGTQNRVKSVYDATIGSNSLATTVAQIVGGTVVNLAKTGNGKAMNLPGHWAKTLAWFSVLHQGTENVEGAVNYLMAWTKAQDAKKGDV